MLAPPLAPQEHGPGGKRFTFCIGKDAAQPQRSRFLMAAKQVGGAGWAADGVARLRRGRRCGPTGRQALGGQCAPVLASPVGPARSLMEPQPLYQQPAPQGGRDEVHLFLNSRCRGPPCARLRCNMFATQVGAARCAVLPGRALAACSVLPQCCARSCCPAQRLAPLPPTRPAPAPAPVAAPQYKLLLSDDLQLEPCTSQPGCDPGGSSVYIPQPPVPPHMARLQSWPTEAAAEAVAAARRRAAARMGTSLSLEDVEGPQPPLGMGCLAELHYQARVKGFMQPRK